MSNKSRSNENCTDESMSDTQSVKIKLEETEESVTTLDTIEIEIVKVEVPEFSDNSDSELEDGQLSHDISTDSYSDSSSSSNARVERNPTTVGNNWTNLRSPFERIVCTVDPCRDVPIISNKEEINGLYDSPIEGSTLMVDPKSDISGIYRGFTSFAIAGNQNGRIGYSLCYNKCLYTALSGAIERAKLSFITISRCMYNFNYGKYYTVPYQVIGQSAHVTVKLSPDVDDPNLFETCDIPIIRMLKLAGIHSCNITVTGTEDNFNANLGLATFNALQNLVD